LRAGVVEGLLNVLASDTSNELAQHACVALGSLAYLPEDQAASYITPGVVASLFQCLKSSLESVQFSSARALCLVFSAHRNLIQSLPSGSIEAISDLMTSGSHEVFIHMCDVLLALGPLLGRAECAVLAERNAISQLLNNISVSRDPALPDTLLACSLGTLPVSFSSASFLHFAVCLQTLPCFFTPLSCCHWLIFSLFVSINCVRSKFVCSAAVPPRKLSSPTCHCCCSRAFLSQPSRPGRRHVRLHSIVAHSIQACQSWRILGHIQRHHGGTLTSSIIFI
jgi:hypothetical protein